MPQKLWGKKPKLYSLLKVKVRKRIFFKNFASSPLWIGSMENTNLLTVNDLSYLSKLLHLWMLLGLPKPVPCSYTNFPKHLCQYVHRNTWLHIPPDERPYFHHADASAFPHLRSTEQRCGLTLPVSLQVQPTSWYFDLDTDGHFVHGVPNMRTFDPSPALLHFCTSVQLTFDSVAMF